MAETLNNEGKLIKFVISFAGVVKHQMRNRGGWRTVRKEPTRMFISAIRWQDGDGLRPASVQYQPDKSKATMMGKLAAQEVADYLRAHFNVVDVQVEGVQAA